MEKTTLINTQDFETSLEICMKENYGEEFLILLKKASGRITSSTKERFPITNELNRDRDYRMMLFGAYSALNEDICNK
jgi:hypothetical protein